jgi:cysteinyl-tRNA synthetase
MSIIKLYNTLTRQKEDFIPLSPDHVRLYACGPTVYNYAHIGNARMAVVFDLLVRVLRGLYPKVTYVSNITDVDDKIMEAAAATGEPIDVITRKYERIYNEDLDRLGVERPDVQPRATEHIPEMIALIKTLIAKGHAYENEGHVLFNVPSFPAYGGLSGRSRDDQIAGARVEIAPYKKDPADFVLWKPSKAEQVGWESPWGRGRPGWHIECSAMAEKHLGLPFDIHGGGADLKFPHHENEIAQSCCAHDSQENMASFARYWVHNGFVTVEGEKMSKSLGNFTLTHDLLTKGIKGETIRFTLLSGHYRQPLDWTADGIQQSERTLERYYHILNELQGIPVTETDIPEAFQEALADDLNTPKAYAELNVLAKRAAEEKTPAAKSALLKAGNVLGFLQQDPAAWLGYTGGETKENAEIDALVQERQAARAAKNFPRSDEIRDELARRGVALEDTADGPKWRRV